MDQWTELYNEARRVQKAWEVSPFIEAGGVAAALLTKKGTVYVGVCIDTASSLGMCAERNAIANMLTNGESQIEKIVAVLSDGSVVAPCGVCRESMMQLAKDSGEIEVLLDYEERKVSNLKELFAKLVGQLTFFMIFFESPHCIREKDLLILEVGVAAMANEESKDFNRMLHDNKDMPKIQIITDQKSIEKYGGKRMYFAPPLDYDQVMKQVPYGQVVTVGEIREYFAEQAGADFTEPITAGIFVSIAAWASHQRTSDKTPYWRTLKAKGELNPKYPGGILAQKEKLEAEGHHVIRRGRKHFRYYVADYEAVQWAIKEV